jgi:hypothetical protein
MNKREQGQPADDERSVELLHQRLDKIEQWLEEIACALETRERVIQGWAAIAAELGFSQSHARRLSQRELYRDPLPVHRMHGGVIAIVSELRAWRVRQTRPGIR